MKLSDLYHPAVSAWFDRHFCAPTSVQDEAWPIIEAAATR
jgi:Lhr-like helicase